MASTHRISAFFVLLLLIAPLLAEAADDAVVLQLKWKHQFQFAGFYMALEKGFYRNAHFDVQVEEIVVGKSAVGELENGNADFAVADPGVMLARADGMPVKVLAAIFQHSPLALIVLQESGIRRFADLRGKRVMLAPGLNADITAALGTAGISRQDFIQQDSSYDITDLVKGNTDAFSGYITDQPNQLRLMNVAYRILHPRDKGIDFYGDVLVTTEKLVQQQPARVQAFTRASMQGWEYALEHMDETIDLILKKYNTQQFSRQQLEFEAQMTKDMIEADIVHIGFMRLQRWQSMAEIYVAQGLLPEDFAVSELLHQPQPGLIAIIKEHIWQFSLSLLALLILLLGFNVLALRRAVKQRTDSLHKSEAKFRSTVEGISDGFFILENNELLVSYFNALAEAMFNRKAEDALGKPFFEVFPEMQDTIFENHYRKTFNTGKFSAFETCLGEEPERNWYDVRVYPVKNGISVFFQNISKRKQIEAVLREEEERLAQAQKVAHMGSWSWNIPGNKLDWSDEIFRIFGMEAQEFQPSYESFLEFVHPDDRENLQQHVDRALAGNPYDFEHRIIRKDGSERIVHEMGQVHFDDAGKPVHMLGTVQDISEQVHMERQLHQTQKMEALGTLIGGIAHDFNNKLTGITSSLFLAQKEASAFPNILNKIEVANQLSFEVAKVIRNLLTFIKGDYLQKEQLNMNGCIEDVLEMYSVPSQIGFHVDLYPAELRINGEKLQIQEVIIKVLDNAMDAVKDVSHPTIALKSDIITADLNLKNKYPELKGDRFAYLEVKDNGVGISSKNIEHVFEPFFTTKDNIKGQGLGLSISYGLIQNHQGAIGLNSAQGFGTSVHIYLPLSDGDSAA